MFMSISFDYIEDYIQFIGGQKYIPNISDPRSLQINLARYDVNIVNSFCAQISLGKAFTDKQSNLALQLVDKYKKQMSRLTPPITVPDSSKKFKYGIRQINRDKKAYIRNSQIVLQFPFDAKLIEEVKKQARDGIGNLSFNYDTKEWTIGITEHNINWLTVIASQFDIKLDPDICDLFEKIIAVEKTNYQIMLDFDGDKFYITNAEQSLIDFIDSTIGGFGSNNLVALADNASVLGYKISDTVLGMLAKEYDPALIELIAHRNINMNQRDNLLDDILRYARVVNRLPIHVYDNGTPKKDTEEVIYLNGLHREVVKPKLMVRTGQLMFGTRKNSWVANSEKIITII